MGTYEWMHSSKRTNEDCKKLVYKDWILGDLPVPVGYIRRLSEQ